MNASLRLIVLFFILSHSLAAQRTVPPAQESPSVMEADCNTPAFLKYYGRLLNTDYGRDIVATPDNGSIAVGYAGNNGRSTDGLVIRLDSKGGLIWKKQWGLEADGDFLSRIISLKDGNYLAMGYTLPNTFDIYLRLWLVKFDINGSVIFSKYISLPGGIAVQGSDICETSDGGFAIAGSKQTIPNRSESIVIRLEANAEIKWIVSSDNPFVNSGKTFTGIIEYGGNLVVTGYISDPSTRIDGLLFTLNSVTGSLVWQKRYEIDNMWVRFNDVVEKNGIYFIDASHTINQSFDGLQQCVFQINQDGSVRKGIRMDPSISQSHEYHSLLPLADGSFITTQATTASKDILLFKVSAAGVIQWKKKYSQSDYQQIFRLKQSPDSSIIGVGNLNYASGYGVPELLVMKANTLGEIGQCVSIDQPLSIVTPVYTISAANIIFDKVSLKSEQAAFSVYDTDLQTYSVCYTTSTACEVTAISGPVKVCSLRDTIEFYASRSAVCATPVRWQIDNEFFKVVSKTDSTVRVIFQKSGVTTIQAKPDNNCNTNYTSLTVAIKESPVKVDLGPDLKICPSNTVLVKAADSFESYLWNNGNTDSTLSVKAPGKYSVTATDFCGTVFFDEIEVFKTDEQFDLGPDRFACDNDSLVIMLPDGYTVASWLPNYNSSLVSNNAIAVMPAADTSYIVSSLLYPGCLKSDTVKVFVKSHLPFTLGNDTSVCEGQTVVFLAPAGFSSYLWSDNSTQSSFLADRKNTYWLQATAPNGCITRDTISILGVYKKPVIGFGNELQMCEGAELFLDAGNDFLNYKWQDGSSKHIFIANKAGQYWVDVIDRNGCFGSDTANVSSVPLPKSFLNKETRQEMCINSKPLELSAKGTWASYLWSTNTRLKTTLATSPGLYWLEVTNAANCRARDSIVVLEKANCLQGLYFPNAFTPNADGKNDVFKPIFFIVPESYLLVVFNRYGEKVFESSDPVQGWSGLVKQKSPSSNSFVWYCKYKFAGSHSQVSKGTVTIIR